MKLAIGAFAIGLGYAMVYYAIGLFQNYHPTTNVDAANTQDLYYSFSYLLGFPNNGKFASLPFKFQQVGSGMAYTPPAPASNTTQPSMGGGAILV
jgi:hypothetical protein